MRNIKFDPAAARFGKHRREPLRLQIIERVVRFVATGQMRHDAPDPNLLGRDRARQGGQHRRVLPRADSVAIQSGVDLDRHLRGAAGPGYGSNQILDLTQRRDTDSHVRVQGGVELRARHVQPRQHRRGDAVGAKSERLIDRGDPEFGHSGRQRRTGDR